MATAVTPERGPAAASSHPLLGLPGPGRRQLAKALLAAAAEARAAERQAAMRDGLLAVALTLPAAGVAGLLLAPPWGLAAGLAAQAIVGWLAPRGPAAFHTWATAPERLFSLPARWLATRAVPGERLVLAAGILVASRRTVSRHLLARYYARAFAPREIEAAIALLAAAGWMDDDGRQLRLTVSGVRLLKELDVVAPPPRARRDIQIPPSLLAAYAALERGEGIRPPEVEPLRRPATPARPKAPAVRRPSFVVPWRRLAVLAAAAAALMGAIALGLSWRPTWPSRPGLALEVTPMPHSRGSALQYNGRGMLLSSFAGELYLSMPDRLDYKRVLGLTGFDMADGCGLHLGPIQRARMSPHGRFMLTDVVRPWGLERCLVDLETRTVTHDLLARHRAYDGEPIGWIDDAHVMVESSGPRQAWNLVDVGSHQARVVALPTHHRVLLAPVEGATPLVIGLDGADGGKWALTSYWLAPDGRPQRLQHLEASLPESLAAGVPKRAALSPDKRLLLLTLAGADGDGLAVVSLADGQAAAVPAEAAAIADEPVFFAPDLRGGRYRFVFNGATEAGVAPWRGSVVLPTARR